MLNRCFVWLFGYLVVRLSIHECVCWFVGVRTCVLVCLIACLIVRVLVFPIPGLVC